MYVALYVGLYASTLQPFNLTGLVLETGTSPQSWSKYNGTKNLVCTDAIALYGPRTLAGTPVDLYSLIVHNLDYVDLVLFENKTSGAVHICQNFSVSDTEVFDPTTTTIWWRCNTGGTHSPTFAPTHLPTPVQDDALFGPQISYDEALLQGLASNSSLFYNRILVHENISDWILLRYSKSSDCKGSIFIDDGTYTGSV